MAIAVNMNFAGGTLEQYDAVCKKMGLAPKGPAPDGALFHWAAKTDDGFRVTDVWETRDQFDKFAAEKIGPFAAEVGFTGQPEMSFTEVYNYFTTP
ncbi:MAG: hypothetical protein ACHQIG_01745 [Acidimicrobiia bacterium]